MGAALFAAISYSAFVLDWPLWHGDWVRVLHFEGVVALIVGGWFLLGWFLEYLVLRAMLRAHVSETAWFGPTSLVANLVSYICIVGAALTTHGANFLMFGISDI
ncbi:MAG: hypothetical protein D6E12_15900 [Desulfovibrio sp.]|nr:MAG: hypothetical protein D6E12_15900 [Desulfovibrio sp.]